MEKNSLDFNTRPILSFSLLYRELLLQEILPSLDVTSRAQWRRTERHVAHLFLAPRRSFDWTGGGGSFIRVARATSHEDTKPPSDILVDLDVLPNHPTFTWLTLRQAVYDDHMGLIMQHWTAFRQCFDPSMMPKLAMYSARSYQLLKAADNLERRYVRDLLQIALFGTARFAYLWLFRASVLLDVKPDQLDTHDLHLAAMCSGSVDFALAVFPSFNHNREVAVAVIASNTRLFKELMQHHHWPLVNEVYAFSKASGCFAMLSSCCPEFLAYGFCAALQEIYYVYTVDLVIEALRFANAATGFQLLFEKKPDLFRSMTASNLAKAAKQADFPPLLEWLDQTQLVPFNGQHGYALVHYGGKRQTRWVYGKMRTWEKKPRWFDPFFKETPYPREFGDVL